MHKRDVTKKEKDLESKRNWRMCNSNKRKAQNIINNAIRDGKLIPKTSCDRCGSDDRRPHAHHDDYDKPLDISWLCPACHGLRHRELNAAKRVSDGAETPSRVLPAQSLQSSKCSE